MEKRYLLILYISCSYASARSRVAQAHHLFIEGHIYNTIVNIGCFYLYSIYFQYYITLLKDVV